MNEIWVPGMLGGGGIILGEINAGDEGKAEESLPYVFS